METRERKFSGGAFSTGSALILTVVLTSMLAIVGILFVMMARVDNIATSAISENKELNLAIETVIAEISQQLVSDTPGILGQEYYDYPDANNPWLASLEPILNDGGTPADLTDDVYYWQHISDVNNQLGLHAWGLSAGIISDYQSPVEIGDSNVLGINPYPADADGDGASDSVWIKLPDMTGSKGQPIYVAVRVVDNEAMLNANVGFKFDPAAADANLIDGSSQTQINLAALSQRGANGTLAEAADKLQNVRCGIEPNDIFMYEKNVVWRYYLPAGAYTPFDISDELELRNRFLVNHPDIDTRIEETWDYAFQVGKRTPFDSNLPEWYQRSYHDMLLPNLIYSYRHIGTTYSMDRIIDPNGDKMLNVNRETSALKIYNRLTYPFVPDPNTDQRFAQLAVNLVDFADEDDEDGDEILDVNSNSLVTTLVDTSTGIIHYGFEAQPFINEIAWKIAPAFFALELCNPFDKDIDLGDFVLEFVNRNNPADQYLITFPFGELIKANGYYVIVNQAGQFAIYNDPNTPTTVWPNPALRFFENWIESEVDKSKPPIDRRPDPDKSKPPIPQGAWGSSYDVSLLRSVLVPAPGTMIYVDNQAIEPNLAMPGSSLAFGRDDREWRVVYQTLAEDVAYGGSLGIANYRHIPFDDPSYSYPKHLYSFFLPNPLFPPARFITVGDIPRILTLGHGTTRNSTIGRQLMAFEQLELSTAVDQEHNVRLDVQNPLHRNVFQYLTVFDPNSDNIDNDADGLVDEDDGSEWKIPGRININTAPWYVLAQLPWVSQRRNEPFNQKLAQAIVDHRDVAGAFGSIGELNFVGVSDPNAFSSIGYYARTDGPQAGDLLEFPDLTFGDGIEDDFEERDVIFSRISNLVTVRSDVFTAYILVRIGTDGPQKRAVAILDRSGVNKMNFSLPDGKVRIVALHYVPDPR